MHVIQKEGNEIAVLRRKPDGTREEILVKDFHPYFYISEDEKIPDDDRIVSVQHGFKSLFNEHAVRLVLDSPRSTYNVREMFKKTFEDDIRYTDRYLIDNPQIIEQNEPIRYVVFDIEVESMNEFPAASEAKHEIISISCYDSLTKKSVVFVQRKDLPVEKRYTSKEYSGKIHDYIIYSFNNERSMLACYCKYLKLVSPDIMLGWNAVDYDAQYLFNRFKNIHMNPRKLSPVEGYVNMNVSVDPKSPKVFINIEGTTIIDAQQLYKTFQWYLAPQSQFGVESYALDSIGILELGEGKSELKNPTISWLNDIENLIFYNYYDVFLTKSIIERVKMIDLLNTLRLELKVSWDAVLYAGKYLDIYALREINKLGFVLPSRRSKGFIPYEGAFTKSPTAGLLKNVIEFDMRSMYPSLILDFKLSPENISDNGTIVVDDVKFLNRDGVLQYLTNNLYIKRIALKEESKKIGFQYGVNSEEWKHIYVKQVMYKIVINSLYGVFGYSKFRLFDVRIAKGITYLGRYIIQYINSYVESLGYKVVYNDTDSVFIKVDEKLTETELDILYKELLEKINTEIKQKSEMQFKVSNADHMEIEIDRIYKSVLFVESKKKYMGIVINSKGKKCYDFVVAGFEIKRRNIPPFAKRILKSIYLMILEEKGQDDVQKTLSEGMKSIINSDFRDFGITVRIGKDLDEYKVDAQHFKAVKYSGDNLKKFFSRMDYVKIVFVKSVPAGLPTTDVIALTENDTLPEGFSVDYKRTLVRILEMNLQRIFSILGWDIDFNYNFTTGQKELSDYF